MSAATACIPTAALGAVAPAHIRGYHLLMDEPIKEAVWESINRDILNKAGCTVASVAGGSHASGADIHCTLGSLSNKTAKAETDGSIAISSYRLTTVCSDATPGTPEAIIAEIERRKNFQYYSILVRTEEPASMTYDWYLIPADHPVLSPATYDWRPLLGKRGAKKDTQTGWETEPHPSTAGATMTITFSMSSQLWIHIPNFRTTMEDHLVSSTTVSCGRRMDYADLWAAHGSSSL